MQPHIGRSIYGQNIYGNQRKDGYSFYGQNMRPNQPNKNPYPNNNFYNNNQRSNPNPYPNLQSQNKNQNLQQNQNKNQYLPQNQNKFNNANNKNITIMTKTNKKYSDLEVNAYFRNENNPVKSAKDMEIQQNLDNITNQYMNIFSNINELSKESSKDNSDTMKLNNLKKELEQVDFFNGNEYGNFIGGLFEISKDDKVLNLDYDSYKKKYENTNKEIKNIIDKFKYEIVLYVNKDNVTKEDYQKLNDYINSKKQKQANNNFNIFQNKSANNDNKYNNNSNKNGNNINFGDNYKNMSYNPKNDLIYTDGDTNGQNEEGGFNLLNDDIYDQNEENGQNNQKKSNYEDPNDISDYNVYKSFDDNNNNNQKNAEPIKVKFIIDGVESFHEVKSNDSGEVLYLLAMQEKDDPVIYADDGRSLKYESLLKQTVGEIFKNCEPILNVY